MKVLYFLPVSKQFLSKWEYFDVDLHALSDLFDEVVVCDSLLKVLLNSRNVDAIYCWWWHRSVLASLIARFLRIKIVATGAIHMFDTSGSPDFYSSGLMYRLANKLSLRLASANLFISYDQYRQVTSHLTVNNPIVVRSSIGKAHSSSYEQILDQRKNIKSTNSDKVTFLSISWQTKIQFNRKGLWETLGALSVLKANCNKPFQWIVAGKEGDATALFRSRVEELGLENEVTLLTDVSQLEKRDLLLQADLYLQPSWYEGFGNAVLEAMSFGTPVLVSRYAAQPEVVGDSGLIAYEMNHTSIAEKLIVFMSLDFEGRRLLSEKALQRSFSEFSYRKRVMQLSSVFSSLGVPNNEFAYD